MVARPNVYILPGFMGSTLRAVYSVGPSLPVWYSPTWLAANGPDIFQLAPDGFSRGPLAGTNCVPSGPVDMGIYEPLISAIANAGYNPIFWAYDWRQSIIRTGNAFSVFLSGNQAAEPYYVVGHSMGGLVARWAYDALPASPLKNSWTRSVYLGVPHGGSYTAAQYLGSQTPKGWQIVLMGNLLNPIAPQGNLFNRVFSNANKRLKQVLATWPSLYEMLPSILGPWTNEDPVAGSFFLLGTWGGINEYITQAQLDRGLATITQLNAILTGDRPAEVSILGTGQNTPDEILIPPNPGLVNGYGYTLSGDSVTTLDRGTLPGVRTERITTDHYGVANGGQALAIIGELLTRGLTGDTIAPPPILPPAPELIPETEWNGSGAEIGFSATIKHGDP